MSVSSENPEQSWAAQQIQAYRVIYPRYEAFADVLRQILEKVARIMAPDSIIQTRPKAIPSFAEKAIRKKKVGRYSDPLQRMTDLCGGRIIVQTQAEVRAVSEFIETHFLIDAGNSVDVSQRLKPSEFGYRSIHYIVQLKPGVFPTRAVPVEIPTGLYPDPETPMKAEIQVRTVVEHAWAGFAHDRVYKGAFRVPSKWERELAGLAGLLELTDQSFSRIQAGLQEYAANYGAYLTEAQLRDEIGTLEAVFECDSTNPGLAYRIGKLYMELGDLEKARDTFSRFTGSGYPPLLRDLGVVTCKLNASDPNGQAYRQGQEYLQAACAPIYKDVDALASLAGSWKSLDEEKARQLYSQAYQLDPSDPYAVSNYLVYEIAHQGSLAPASLMAPSIEAAIRRCQDQVDVGMNIPWAFYNLGVFYLLQGKPYHSLSAYLRAIRFSSTGWMVETSQRLLNELAPLRESILGYAWVERLLTLSRAVLFQDAASLAMVHSWANPAAFSPADPAIIFAGGSYIDLHGSVHACLQEAFKDFRGVLISGGTTTGISALAGLVQESHPSISTVGYVPSIEDNSIQIHPGYRRIQRTTGVDFSPLEPLQYWIDLIAAGFQPEQVRLFGIDGGDISAFEYRLALLLGAQVFLLGNSGGEAAAILSDPAWKNTSNLRYLSDKDDLLVGLKDLTGVN